MIRVEAKCKSVAEDGKGAKENRVETEGEKSENDMHRVDDRWKRDSE